MSNIIIGFPHIENARNIKKILMKNGYEVNGVCELGAQLISIAGSLDGGIVICGYQFSDMIYKNIYESLQEKYHMIVVASGGKLELCNEKDIIKVMMPLHVSELIAAIEGIMRQEAKKQKREKAKPKFRSPKEQALIDEAKRFLMESKHISENEAHRYLQKISMDSGNSFVESAGMLLDIYGKEWKTK